jgi:O-methyltransferase involved in polyketide biosynthesis
MIGGAIYREAHMASKQKVRLGAVQETMLVPLFARAVDAQSRHPILNDRKAVEIAAAIDWDFARFRQRWRVLSAVLRTAIIDVWVKDFLARHPQGTVVEIGAGLNTRFERLDNGTLRWFDLDLPDAIALRRQFFDDTARRTALAGSASAPEWIAAVKQSPGPYFFVAEGVLFYLPEAEVKAALAQIGENFPGAHVAFDTTHRRAAAHGNRSHARCHLKALAQWSCDDAKDIESWPPGWRLLESRGILELPVEIRRLLTRWRRLKLAAINKLVPQISRFYRLNLFAGGMKRPLRSNPR